MEGLLNIIRREVFRAMGTRASTRVGLVASYDPTNHAAKVTYQPEGTLSGWLPVGTAMAGNGFGVHFAPTPGDQVLVHFLEGDHDTGVIGMRLYSDADRPLNVPAGDMWAIHSSGSGFKFHADGSGEIITTAGLTATVGGALTANVTGSATLTSPHVIVDSANVELGGTGGAKVARVGDTVDLGTGLITSGSNKVKAA